MHNKCPFCRRNYSRSGAYEKDLGNANANLDIVLASRIKYASSLTTNDNKGSNILPMRGISAWIPTMNQIEIPLDIRTAHSMPSVTSLIQRYSTKLQVHYPVNQCFMKGPANLYEMSRVLSKNKAICVSTHGPHLVARTVSS